MQKQLVLWYSTIIYFWWCTNKVDDFVNFLKKNVIIKSLGSSSQNRSFESLPTYKLTKTPMVLRPLKFQILPLSDLVLVWS